LTENLAERINTVKKSKKFSSVYNFSTMQKTVLDIPAVALMGLYDPTEGTDESMDTVCKIVESDIGSERKEGMAYDRDH